MSGGLAPSKSTCYVGNLPFTLTNNDIHQVFEKFGKIGKVTILRDKHTRESKGVAFVQYVERASATTACQAINEKQLFDRKIKCVIATDNGRASEFIKKKEYPDKSKCYECGEFGHLSYSCSKNVLGDREPPPKKEKKVRKRNREDKANAIAENKKKLKIMYAEEDDGDEGDDSDLGEGEDPRLSRLSTVIDSEAEKYRYHEGGYDGGGGSEGSYAGGYSNNDGHHIPKKKKIKQSSYFSDEDEVDEE